MSKGKDETNSIDIKQAWKNLERPKKKKPGQRIAEQAASERQHTQKTDRRRTGRTTQMNLKVKDAVHKEIKALAEAKGMVMGELLEIVFTEWKQKGGK